MRHLCVLLAGLMAACAPGEFTDDEKQELRRELEQSYGSDDSSEEDDIDREATEDDEASGDGSTSNTDDTSGDDATDESDDSSDDTVAGNADDAAVDDAAGATDDASGDDTADDASGDDTADAMDDAEGDGEIPTCVLAVFEDSCAGAGCHYGNAVNSFPDLEQDGLYGFLTSEGPLTCPSATTNLVDLDSPMESYLLLKIRPNPPCGVQMPSGSSLNADQTQCLEDWFASLE
jgi:hypothetical protein